LVEISTTSDEEKQREDEHKFENHRVK